MVYQNIVDINLMCMNAVNSKKLQLTIIEGLLFSTTYREIELS